MHHENPTKIELFLYKYAGYYPVRIEDGVYEYKTVYADHPSRFDDNGYPTFVDMGTVFIGDSSILFQCLPETVEIHGTFDSLLIDAIHGRMEELGFQSHVSNPTTDEVLS